MHLLVRPVRSDEFLGKEGNDIALQVLAHGSQRSAQRADPACWMNKG